jgi:capsular polysaccharide biosynthesis protein
MSEENREDDVSLLYIFNLMYRYKRWIFGAALTSGMLAILLVNFVLSPRWESSAILEVGHDVGHSEGSAENNKPIEPVVNAVARMMMPSFAEEVLRNEGISLQDPKKFVGSLKAVKMKDAELIEIKVRAPSKEMALAQLEASVGLLKKIHSSMMRNAIEARRKNLGVLVHDVQVASEELALLKSKLFVHRDWNSFDATLMASVWKDKSQALYDMKKKKNSLEDQLSAQEDYETKVLGVAEVSSGPVSPNKPIIVLFAILLGLVAGIVFALVHNAIATQSRVN